MKKGLCLPLIILSSFFAQPVYATDSKQRAEIVYRAQLGRADDVALLIKQGVSPDTTNDQRIPLIALAAKRTDDQAIPVIDALLENGADINARDALGRTALFHAASINNKPVVLHLLDKGIDYYIVDNSGNVARNMAHNEGYHALVQTMDQFVIDQSNKMKKEYEAYSQLLADRYDKQKALVDEHKEREQEALENNERLEAEQQAAYQAALHKLQMLELERQRAIVDKRNSKEFFESFRQLAYDMCAFQYWSYCQSLGQTTEVKGDALDSLIDKHYDAMITASDALKTEYKLEQSYVDAVTERAQQRIYYELDRMPSKTYRFQNGVGKLKDVSKRCERIAKYWNIELAEDEIPSRRRGQQSDDRWDEEY